MAESVTRWIDLLKAGDPAAAQPLWQRYFEQLVRLARVINGLGQDLLREQTVTLQPRPAPVLSSAAGPGNNE